MHEKRSAKTPKRGSDADQIVGVLAPAEAGLAHARHQRGLLAAARLAFCACFELLQRVFDAALAAAFLGGDRGRPRPCASMRGDRFQPLLALASRRSGADRARPISTPPTEKTARSATAIWTARGDSIRSASALAFAGVGGVERGGEPRFLAVVAGAVPEGRAADAGGAVAADDAAVRILAERCRR